METPANDGTSGADAGRFDPYVILSALQRNRVSYVVIGGFARVVQGTREVTHGLDITPSLRRENIARINRTLAELDARATDGQPASLSVEPVAATQLRTRAGTVTVVPLPEGTRGYDDLRRHATYEAIGRGLRAQIASPGDLARMLGALDRPEDQAKLLRLRRMIELGRELDFGLEL
ncbi:MAG: hypothetical protein ACRDQZ_15190 [Mycobacteriales bacterium]